MKVIKPGNKNAIVTHEFYMTCVWCKARLHVQDTDFVQLAEDRPGYPGTWQLECPECRYSIQLSRGGPRTLEVWRAVLDGKAEHVSLQADVYDADGRWV